LKPNPYLISNAIKRLEIDPRKCIFVGDSATDIEAAHAAGVRIIAYANKVEKIDRFNNLDPEAIVTRISKLKF
jgi:beta-phosphoglucomutase-like phosphatase (HAD superfamily)